MRYQMPIFSEVSYSIKKGLNAPLILCILAAAVISTSAEDEEKDDNPDTAVVVIAVMAAKETASATHIASAVAE